MLWFRVRLPPSFCLQSYGKVLTYARECLDILLMNVNTYSYKLLKTFLK